MLRPCTHLGSIGIEAGCHSSGIAPQIVMALSRSAERRLEQRTQQPGQKGECSCTEPRRFAAQHKVLAAEEVGARIDRTRPESDDLVGRMAAHTLTMERTADLSTHHCHDQWPSHDQWPKWRWHGAEEVARSLGEIYGIHPAGVDRRPIEMVLKHLLESPADGALLRAQPAVEIDSVLLLQMPANEGRIRNDLPVIDDVGELAFRRLLFRKEGPPSSEGLPPWSRTGSDREGRMRVRSFGA